MGLGQFAADRDPALAAEFVDGVMQTLREPAGRFEEHTRARLVGQRGEEGPAGGLLAWREALEAEPVGG